MSIELVEDISSRKKRHATLILGILSTLVGIAIGETLLRFFFPPPSGNFIHHPHLVRTFTPDPKIMPGVQGPSEFRVNSLGVRGSEIPGRGHRALLALGGSTTECLYLDQEEAWPRILEKRLQTAHPETPVWVGNAGKTGTSSREHRLQVPILLDDIPRVETLILLAGVNDVLLRLAVDEKYDPDFVLQPGSHDFLMHRAFDIVRSTTGQEHIPLFPRRVIGLLLQSIGNLAGIRTSPETLHLVEDRAGEMYVQRRLYRRNRIGTRETLPDLSTGLREYENNIKDCIRAARERNIDIVLVSQPVLWKENLSPELEDLLWTGGVGNISAEGIEYYSSSALAQAMEQYNARLAELAGKESVPLVDLASRLPKDTTVFYDDCHFNEGGAERVAEILFEFMESR